jgi:hypothetical protein
MLNYLNFGVMGDRPLHFMGWVFYRGQQRPFTYVSGTPARGQYVFDSTAGNYTFSSKDTGAKVTLWVGNSKKPFGLAVKRREGIVRKDGWLSILPSIVNPV